MEPEQIASVSEHSHQAAFFCWIANNADKVDPRLKFAFAVPNGGERNKATASRLKAEGVKAGVPDVFVPIPSNCGKYHGLWLEFKRPGTDEKKEGTLSDKQEKYRDYLVSQNYLHFVVYGWLTAVSAVLRYLELK